MRVLKSGKVKLDAGEVRIGNFFVKREKEHIKLCDLNDCFSFRAWERMPIGVWLRNILDMGEKGHDTIKVYISVLWSLFSVVPDDEFVNNLLNETKAALERHPEWYGADHIGTVEEDEKAAKEVREMKEFEEEIKNWEETHEEGGDV